MADLVRADFWVIEETDMEMHPFTVLIMSYLCHSASLCPSLPTRASVEILCAKIRCLVICLCCAVRKY